MKELGVRVRVNACTRVYGRVDRPDKARISAILGRVIFGTAQTKRARIGEVCKFRRFATPWHTYLFLGANLGSKGSFDPFCF
jgi:hypothetical protein